MAQRIPTRLGDGSLVEMTRAEVEADLHAGSEAAVKRAKVEPLAQDELDHLLDIFTSPAKFTAVDYGDEVILGFDGSGNADLAAPVLEQIVYQNHHGADMIELWHHDYSYKAVRTVLSFQTQMLKDAQLQTVVPLNYGAMPDLGRYSQPDGPAPNWSELMPLGRIAEARAAQEEAAVQPSATCGASPRPWSPPAWTVSTSTPPAPPATPTCWPRSAGRAGSARRGPTSASRSARPPSSCSACTASSSSTAPGWPASGRSASSAPAPPPAPRSSGRR